MAPATRHDYAHDGSKSKKRLFEDDVSAAEPAYNSEHASASHIPDFIPVKTQNGEPAEDVFGINRNYASRYDNWRKKEEQQRLKSKYGDELHANDDDESTSDEDSDEADDVLAPAEDIDFLRALSLVKKKDPRMYSTSFQIFTAAKDNGDADDATEDADSQSPKKRTNNAKKQGVRPLTLAGYEVKIAIEKGGDLEDEDADEGASTRLVEFDNDNEMRKKFSYDQEQRETKKAFLAVLDAENDGAETGAGGGGDNLLAKRTKTAEEERSEERSYLQWLKGKRSDLGSDDPVVRNAEKDLQFLHDYWNDPKLDEGEQFLRDYILNKRYLATEAGEGDDEAAPPKKQQVPAPRVFRMPDKEAEPDVEVDEKEVQREEEFEHKYNFRFEEPDPDFIKLYPRTIGDSVRAATKPTSTRKLQRESARERQQRLLQQRREEIRQYKTMIKQEVVEKIEKLKHVAGNDALDLTFEELEADFDPAEYDKKMRKLFGNEYYNTSAEHAVDDEKPVFSDESDLEDDWDTYDLKREENEANENAPDSDTVKKSIEPADEIETSDAVQRREPKKAKRLSKFAQVLEQPGRPPFDPNSGKTFEEYFDDYYKLDYEDVIAGGQIPTRFHYRKTQPNNFGLTAEEILLAPESELNAWVSLKRVVAQRDDYEEERDDRLFKQMANSTFKKKKKLPSLFKIDAREVIPNDTAAAVPGEDVAQSSEAFMEPPETVDEVATSSSLPTDAAENDDAEQQQTPSAVADVGQSKKKRRRRQKSQPAANPVKPSGEPSNEAVHADPDQAVENGVELKTASVQNGVGKKRRRRNRNKSLKNGLSTVTAESTARVADVKQRSRPHHSASKKPAQQQRHRPLTEAVRQHPVFQLSDERLRAYGLNPKKIRNRVQYGAE